MSYPHLLVGIASIGWDEFMVSLCWIVFLQIFFFFLLLPANQIRSSSDKSLFNCIGILLGNLNNKFIFKGLYQHYHSQVWNLINNLTNWIFLQDVTYSDQFTVNTHVERSPKPNISFLATRTVYSISFKVNDTSSHTAKLFVMINSATEMG